MRYRPSRPSSSDLGVPLVSWYRQQLDGDLVCPAIAVPRRRELVNGDVTLDVGGYAKGALQV